MVRLRGLGGWPSKTVTRLVFSTVPRHTREQGLGKNESQGDHQCPLPQSLVLLEVLILHLPSHVTDALSAVKAPSFYTIFQNSPDPLDLSHFPDPTNSLRSFLCLRHSRKADTPDAERNSKRPNLSVQPPQSSEIYRLPSADGMGDKSPTVNSVRKGVGLFC